MNRAIKYLNAGGVAAAEVDDLRVAARLHPSHLLVIRFRATKETVHRFVRGKNKVRQTGGQAVSKFLSAGYGTRYPYTELAWWPPLPEQYTDLSVFEGVITWKVPQMPQGQPYGIVIDERRNLVYVVGW
jgi:hypothetical protein